MSERVAPITSINTAQKKRADLTGEMRECVEFMMGQGGRIYRSEQGPWSVENFNVSTTPYNQIFSHATVKALVSRGLARWSTWENARGSRYPVEAELVEFT